MKGATVPAPQDAVAGWCLAQVEEADATLLGGIGRVPGSTQVTGSHHLQAVFLVPGITPHRVTGTVDVVRTERECCCPVGPLDDAQGTADRSSPALHSLSYIDYKSS